jgi:SAM-dependent methyltransferase
MKKGKAKKGTLFFRQGRASIMTSLTMKLAFDDLYQDPGYRLFKTHLFNYRLRKNRIAPLLFDTPRPVLDVGSGIAPMVSPGTGTILGDTSLAGMRVMKEAGFPAAVIDLKTLGVKSGGIGTIICSEVLEHIDDDQAAIRELSRVLRPGGRLVLTVPLHQYYWRSDDTAVGHFRRYHPESLVRELSSVGLALVSTAKIGSLPERLLTAASVAVFSRSSQKSQRRALQPTRTFRFLNLLAAHLLDLAARIGPARLNSVGLFYCEKAARREDHA